MVSVDRVRLLPLVEHEKDMREAYEITQLDFFDREDANSC